LTFCRVHIFLKEAEVYNLDYSLSKFSKFESKKPLKTTWDKFIKEIVKRKLSLNKGQI